MRTQHAMINIVSLHLGHATDAENPDQELKRQLAEMKKTNGTYEFAIWLQNKTSKSESDEATRKLNAIAEDVEKLLGKGNPFQGLADDDF